MAYEVVAVDSLTAAAGLVMAKGGVVNLDDGYSLAFGISYVTGTDDDDIWFQVVDHTTDTLAVGSRTVLDRTADNGKDIRAERLPGGDAVVLVWNEVSSGERITGLVIQHVGSGSLTVGSPVTLFSSGFSANVADIPAIIPLSSSRFMLFPYSGSISAGTEHWSVWNVSGTALSKVTFGTLPNDEYRWIDPPSFTHIDDTHALVVATSFDNSDVWVLEVSGSTVTWGTISDLSPLAFGGVIKDSGPNWLLPTNATGTAEIVTTSGTTVTDVGSTGSGGSAAAGVQHNGFVWTTNMEVRDTDFVLLADGGTLGTNPPQQRLIAVNDFDALTMNYTGTATNASPRFVLWRLQTTGRGWQVGSVAI